MSLTSTVRHPMLTELGSIVTQLRLVTSVGATVDTKAVTWKTPVAVTPTATTSEMDITSPIVFNVGAGITVTTIRLLNAGGSVVGEVNITNEAYQYAGTYTLTALVVTMVAA